MHLSGEEENHIKRILAPYQKNEQTRLLKIFAHHGEVTTYEHCMHVVRACYWMNKRWHLHADEKVLVVAAFLHDFYLYDWHDKEIGHRKHMFKHPEIARTNAAETFQIGPKEQHIIYTHMWPLTFRQLPTTREAWMVSLADKYCAIVELIKDRSLRIARRTWAIVHSKNIEY